MYIIIAGAGDVGFQVAKSLRTGKHNIAIIENDSEALERAETLDALVIKGHAANPNNLDEIDIKNAHLFIAVTGSDEINMISSAIAHSKGVRTITRINSREYMEDAVTEEKFKDIGIDVAICPELVAAEKMQRILDSPILLNVEEFAKGRILMLESKVNENSIVINELISNITFPSNCNLVAIFRNSDVIIPRGEDRLLPNDRIIMLMGSNTPIKDIEQLLGKKEQKIEIEGVRRVMIYGATRTGVHLAKLLELDTEVKLIEESVELIKQSSEQLKNTLVLRGDGTNKEILLEEGIVDVDAFIASTRSEETNILSCLLAKQYGATKTIALIDQPELKSMLEYIGIDLSVSPNLESVSTIMQHVHQSSLMAISVLHRGDAQVLEFKVTAQSKIAGKKLKRINFPKNSIVGAIVRRGKHIVPKGDDEINVGDMVIVFAKTDVISKFEKIF